MGPLWPHSSSSSRLAGTLIVSLLDSGKSALKTGSTKLLVNSPAGIKAKPGWPNVASGHADNTGNPKLN